MSPKPTRLMYRRAAHRVLHCSSSRGSRSQQRRPYAHTHALLVSLPRAVVQVAQAAPACKSESDEPESPSNSSEDLTKDILKDTLFEPWGLKRTTPLLWSPGDGMGLPTSGETRDCWPIARGTLLP